MGLNFYVKPHPLELGAWPGNSSVLDLSSFSKKSSLYSLLARSSGLITDFSSVCADYEILQKPIAYLMGDLEKMGRTGAVDTKIMSLVPQHVFLTSKNLAAWSLLVAGWENQDDLVAKQIASSQLTLGDLASSELF